MAGDELAEQLATLGQALKRLEGELVHDAAWRAMRATDVPEAAREQLRVTLEANPVYLAWRNMREAMDVLESRTAKGGAPEAPANTGATRMATTLAEALQQLPPEDIEAEPLPENVAQVLAAQVAAEVSPPVPPRPEQDGYDVGERATQTVERILAIPVVEAIKPRASGDAATTTPAPVPSADPVEASAPPPSAPDTETLQSGVPQEAEDLAFLLKPATRVQPPDQSQFLKRLVSEAQSSPPKAATPPPADPFMVPPAPSVPAGDGAPAAAPDTEKPAGTKPGLARLLKAWSRH